MSLKGKYSSLIFLVISLISCSEKEKSEKDIFLTVSERKEFHIGEGGLVPERFGSVFLDSSRSKGVIFNEIVHSLDSVFLSTDSAWVKDGEFLEAEGPYGVGTVFSFFVSEKHIIYLNSQELFRQDIDTKLVTRKYMHEFGVFGDLDYPAISVPGKPEFVAYNKQTNTAYIVYDYDNRISVLAYSPDGDSMDFVPIPLDSANYFDLRFEVKTGGLTLLGNDTPQLTIVDNQLIVSYPSFSDVLVVDLESNRHQVYVFSSESYPDKRNPPEHFGRESVDVDSFKLLQKWQEEVRYGTMTFVEDWDKFVRLVKGEGGKDSNYFLEVFDVDFQKVQEINLTELNPDLSLSYLNTKYGLMFRAKDQPDEDVMYYYYVNLTDSK
ncbi:hypothetical protein [Algoriphagus sp. NG3]|uniref:hypothetical protein n=1 Tax=unclassified Algoriphagus TaxID=2641541 RepID=UPI002A816C5B|nr:hypothetical protein [Algoriphagus sp. NG3]WPR74228.1 hypothetical protein SLW71_16295 [Algoriphagus sp. NG3]